MRTQCSKDVRPGLWINKLNDLMILNIGYEDFSFKNITQMVKDKNEINQIVSNLKLKCENRNPVEWQKIKIYEQLIGH